MGRDFMSYGFRGSYSDCCPSDAVIDMRMLRQERNKEKLDGTHCTGCHKYLGEIVNHARLCQECHGVVVERLKTNEYVDTRVMVAFRFMSDV